ncbi:EAL domain-containing protein [Hyphomonas sp. CY54-11-8]|uniref:bifunctional diguanylate cyclase/phosphodiesterase n=1 Tax=Hyphomonas sp. CY54-11-8 TaxID=1280944 RepID=UPI000458B857|nr:EAL domain-containing protein [Hyphomonas sp. CY54-11-8]KCZ46645.1 hypothetical protein HY17_07830 [Hyphomonas sp. CY54-11-8]
MLRTVIDCIQWDHDPSLFWLSAATCVVSVFASLWMVFRAWSAGSGIAGKSWGLWAASVFAAGVWSTHFIAMNGYRPIHDVTYDGVITFGSGVVAVTGLLVTALLFGRGQSAFRRTMSGLVAAMTVICLHYSGMEALRGAALIEYDPVYVIASMAVILVAFMAGFRLFVHPDHPGRLPIAGMFLVGGVVGLHFMSMAGLLIIPIAGVNEAMVPISRARLGQIVLIAAGLIPLFGLATEIVFSQVSHYARREHVRMTLLSDAAVEGLLVVRQGLITEVNAALCDLLDIDRQSVLRKPVGSVLTESFLQASRACERSQFCRACLAPFGGEAIPVEVSHRRIGNGDDYEVFAIRDLRESVAIEAEMFRLAYTDAGTGAPNRRAFLHRLEELGSGQESGIVAVGILDLDRFKDINDKFGHAAGDIVLQETYNTLCAEVGDRNMAARIAGDEFGILLGPYECVSDIEAHASDIIAAICQTIDIDGVPLDAGGSPGLAPLGNSTEITLLNADRALYAAKKSGRGSYQLYDDRLQAEYESRGKLEAELRSALQKGEFELLYQPEVSASTMQVRGYEALLRWRRRGDMLTRPDEFLPVAEDTGLINEIGDWVLMTACREASGWSEDQFVAVNVSARQLLEQNLVERVAHVLEATGLEAGRLHIEVTETALVQNSRLTEDALVRLKSLGVQIALDDFGTGYSSISHLHKFPVDTIKIDRSFVQDLPAGKKACAIVDAVCRLGTNLGISIVAEGVETAGQTRYLARSGCTLLQGYRFGVPVPARDIPVSRKDMKQSAA